MAQLIPAVLAGDKKELIRKTEALSALTRRMQIDFIDGEFAANHSVTPEQTSELGRIARLEAHLMVKQPMTWLGDLPDCYDFACIHLEIPHFHDKWQATYDFCTNRGLRLGIAINPDTPIPHLSQLHPQPEMVMVMGVNPGFSGQKMRPETIDRVRKVASVYQGLIGVDGGVNSDNIAALVQAGADNLYIGAGILKADDLPSHWQHLNHLAQG